MNIQASGYFTFSGSNSAPETLSISINGIAYVKNVIANASIPTIINDYVINLNGSLSFAGLNSYAQGNQLYIVALPGGQFDGNAGNKVTLSSINNSGIIIIPSGPTLTGGVSYNQELLSSSILNFSSGHQTPPIIISNPNYKINLEFINNVKNISVTQNKPAIIIANPKYNIHMDILSLGLTEWLSAYLLNFLVAKGICLPINNSGPTVVDGIPSFIFSGDEGIKNFKNGFYYIIPINTLSTVNGVYAPKYLNQIPLPFTAFSYPPSDSNYGKMLVKTFSVLTPIPSDVISISQARAQDDLQKNVFTIFAL